MDIELSEDQKKEVIKERYDLKNIGHPDINKTIKLIIRDFTWPRLRQDIIRYIQTCDICVKAKHLRHRLYNKLQSLIISKEV